MFPVANLFSWSLILVLCSGFSVSANQTKPGKPLSGYNAIIVERPKVEKNPKTEKFPAGYDADLQQNIVAVLRNKGVFAEVIDASRQPKDQALIVSSNSPDARRLILSISIVDFSPGNKALRYTIGWGAGATKVKAKFVFSDAAEGREIFSKTLQGKFLGFLTVHGTGKDYAITEASGDIVDGLIREINKNR
jgi:hypothetical protein